MKTLPTPSVSGGRARVRILAEAFRCQSEQEAADRHEIGIGRGLRRRSGLRGPWERGGAFQEHRADSGGVKVSTRGGPRGHSAPVRSGGGFGCERRRLPAPPEAAVRAQRRPWGEIRGPRRSGAKNRMPGVRPAPSALILEDVGVRRGSPSVHEPRGAYVAPGSCHVLLPGRLSFPLADARRTRGRVG